MGLIGATHDKLGVKIFRKQANIEIVQK